LGGGPGGGPPRDSSKATEMFTLPDTIRARPKHQRGVPGPEYGLIVGLCAQVIVGSMITLGTRVIRPFTTAAALP